LLFNSDCREKYPLTHLIIIDDSDGDVISVLGGTEIDMPTGFQQTGNIAGAYQFMQRKKLFWHVWLTIR
jgi:hypothetical protein